MTAIAALTLDNGETTPVSKTFSPVNINSAGVAKWADRSGGIAVGFPTITYSLREPIKTSKAFKLTLKVNLPVLEQVAPSVVWTKAYDLLANVEIIMPDRSSEAERRDLLAFTFNLLMDNVVVNGVQDYESVF